MLPCSLFQNGAKIILLLFSHTQSCPTLCDPMDCSTPGFPVLHHLPELAQTHVYWVVDAILPSSILLTPSPPAFNLCQHQFSSVQFSRSVMSNSLRPHELQHARPLCPSPTPRIHSDSRPSSQVIPSSHLILCRPLLLLPPIPPSGPQTLVSNAWWSGVELK